MIIAGAIILYLLIGYVSTALYQRFGTNENLRRHAEWSPIAQHDLEMVLFIGTFFWLPFLFMIIFVLIIMGICKIWEVVMHPITKFKMNITIKEKFTSKIGIETVTIKKFIEMSLPTFSYDGGQIEQIQRDVERMQTFLSNLTQILATRGLLDRDDVIKLADNYNYEVL